MFRRGWFGSGRRGRIGLMRLLGCVCGWLSLAWLRSLAVTILGILVGVR